MQGQKSKHNTCVNPTPNSHSGFCRGLRRLGLRFSLGARAWLTISSTCMESSPKRSRYSSPILTMCEIAYGLRPSIFLSCKPPDYPSLAAKTSNGYTTCSLAILQPHTTSRVSTPLTTARAMSQQEKSPHGFGGSITLCKLRSRPGRARGAAPNTYKASDVNREN